MTCQQCGRELPPGTHPRTQFCKECAAKRKVTLRNIRIKGANPFKTCLRCGEALPIGCSLSRQYCDKCAKERNRELTRARNLKKQKRRQYVDDLRKSSEDRAWCSKCAYYGGTGVNLCDYILKTGKLRGCKAGEGCPKQKRRAVYELAK